MTRLDIEALELPGFEVLSHHQHAGINLVVELQDPERVLSLALRNGNVFRETEEPGLENKATGLRGLVDGKRGQVEQSSRNGVKLG